MIGIPFILATLLYLGGLGVFFMYKQFDKNLIRKEILTKRNALTPEWIGSYELSVFNRFISSEAFLSSKVIMLYMDFRNEVPTKLMIEATIKAGKKLILPLTDSNFHIIPYEIPVTMNEITEINIGKYFISSPLGIREPNPALCPKANPLEIDFIVVPGVAFDYEGNRLGYGKGCYDNFLSKLNPNAIKLGLAYDFQILEALPHEQNDRKVDGIL